MTTYEYDTSIVWLRRDLRLRDNVALARAARASRRVCVAFNVDPELLRSDRVGAPIVASFFGALVALREELRALGSDLVVLQGDFATELCALAKRTGARAVFYNEDYDPAARARDGRVEAALRERGIYVEASLDHVYFGAAEIVSDGGTPYKVFTPYKRRWLDHHRLGARRPVESLRAVRGKLIERDVVRPAADVPAPEDFGFTPSASYPETSEALARARLKTFLDRRASRYRDERNLPALDATSHLSPDLRAGTIGIRTCFERAFECAAAAKGEARANVETWISELIWREFYQMLLARFPHVDGKPFVPAAASIPWSVDRAAFERWKNGATGYPIVDAAMRQLNATGWMHNRLRMIVASFLTKDLLIDWRWGERYFEQRLADADLAQNNGGWQWAASTGADAAPYFRVLNPVLQGEKFDPDGTFIRRFVPELEKLAGKYIHAPWSMPPLVAAASGFTLGRDYPEPIVDHAFARDRAIGAYAAVLSNKQRG